MTLRDLWNQMNMSTETTGFLRRLLDAGTGLHLYAGLDLSTRLPLLMLRTGSEVAGRHPNLPELLGFSILWRSFPKEPLHHWLCIQLSEEADTELFESICNDLIHQLHNVTSASRAVEILLQRIQDWQHFLRHRGGRGMHEAARQGLYGELYMLRELGSTIPVNWLLRHWTGPLGAPQDFQLPGLALEIKTQTDAMEAVRISSAAQLAAPERLVLVTLQLEPSADAPSLSELIDAVRSLLSDAEALNLSSLLLRSGYSDLERSLYLHTAYRVIQVRCHEVKEGFPRITPQMLLPGVQQVTYRIQLDQCTGYLVPQHQLHTWLEETHEQHLP